MKCQIVTCVCDGGRVPILFILEFVLRPLWHPTVTGTEPLWTLGSWIVSHTTHRFYSVATTASNKTQGRFPVHTQLLLTQRKLKLSQKPPFSNVNHHSGKWLPTSLGFFSLVAKLVLLLLPDKNLCSAHHLQQHARGALFQPPFASPITGPRWVLSHPPITCRILPKPLPAPPHRPW